MIYRGGVSEAKLKLKTGGTTVKLKGKWASLKKFLGISEDEPLTMGKIGRAMKSSSGRTMGSMLRRRKS